MKKSLGNRLLLILLLATLCVWVSVSSVIWVIANQAIERQLDNQLRTVVSTVSYTIDAFVTAGYHAAPEVSLLDFEVIDLGGGAVYTVSVPEAALPVSINVWHNETLRAITQDSPLFESTHAIGIQDEIVADGSEWRVIRSRLGDTDLWLMVGVSKAELGAESTQLLFAILSPLMAGLLIIMPLIYYSVRNGLKPLRDLEEQISLRSSSDLHAVQTSEVPVEVAPLVSALNRLLKQLSTAMEREKRITADAAHELQTPLAAIKTEAQIALKHSKDIDKTALVEIIERVNRASRAVKQLTWLSRLESADGALTDRVDLHEVCERVCDTYADELKARGLVVHINDAHPLFLGNADMLQILVDNLLRNTLNHASPDSEVLVTLVENDPAGFTVENECQAISNEEWQLITQRFYRVPGSRGDGSGLGMSIIQRICELHGATLEVGKRASGAGFSVSVKFPAHPDPEYAI